MTKQDAIKHFGGVPQLADALGIQRQAIYQWEEIPKLRQFEIERITSGALKVSPGGDGQTHVA